jgi:hypothetical protein
MVEEEYLYFAESVGSRAWEVRMGMVFKGVVFCLLFCMHGST